MRKVKVLHYPFHGFQDGISNYILQNWKHIDKTKFQFGFITRCPISEKTRVLTEDGGRVYPFAIPVQDHLDSLIELVDAALDDGYDVFHLHSSHWWGGFPMEELAVRKGIDKIIVHSHNSSADMSHWVGNERAFLQKHEENKKKFGPELATDFAACSKTAAGWLFGSRVPKDQIFILKNAIDVKKFAFDKSIRDDTRAKLGLENKFVVGNIGRLTWQKNQAKLLEIFAELYKRRNDARLLLIGSGEDEQQLKAHAKTLGVTDAVWFMGRRSDIPDLLKAMDCFVFPSRFEGFSVVLVEAQASGLPCLISTQLSEEQVLLSSTLRLDANASPEIWADEIMDIDSSSNRYEAAERITGMGYDIHRQVQVLERLYKGENLSGYCPTAAD